MGETIINSNQLRASGDTSSQTLIGANQIRQSGDSSSQTLLNKNQIAGGGTKVLGTPVDTVKTSGISLDANTANFMNYRNGKYYWKESNNKVIYSENTDLSNPSTIDMQGSNGTVIFGKNIIVSIYIGLGSVVTSDFYIYDTNFNYIRTINKQNIVNSGKDWNYILYNGYIIIASKGKFVKIEDSTSVTDVTTGEIAGGFIFGQVDGNEALVTCVENAGSSSSKYHIKKVNLDTLAIISTGSMIKIKSYSSSDASNCIKFNNTYYCAVGTTLYTSSDLNTWTSSSYAYVCQRLIVDGDKVYTVCKTGIYVTEDFVTAELFCATTTMTSGNVLEITTAEINNDGLIVMRATNSAFESVIAKYE